MITEVSILCQKNLEVGIRRIPAYTPQYTNVYYNLNYATLLVNNRRLIGNVHLLSSLPFVVNHAFYIIMILLETGVTLVDVRVC